MHEVRPMGCAMCFSKMGVGSLDMRTSSRFIPIASFVAVAAALAGCTYNRTVAVEPAPVLATVPAVVTPAPTVISPAPAVVTTPGSVIVTPAR
jgi:hypothetical protein